MRRPIAIAATAGALAVGGTAIAAPGGGPFGLLGGSPEEHETEFARDIASKLDGVSADQVERALEQVREERHAERQAELARALASELDGVSADEIERALDKAHQRMEQEFKQGEPPERDVFVETLAQELDKSEDQIREALQAAHRARFERKLDDAVESGRIGEERAKEIRERFEDGPPGFRGGPGFGGRRGGPGPHGGGIFLGPGGPP
jgi:hypothetical protein